MREEKTLIKRYKSKEGQKDQKELRIKFIVRKMEQKKEGRLSKLNIMSKQLSFEKEFLRSPREPLILKTVMASRTYPRFWMHGMKSHE